MACRWAQQSDNESEVSDLENDVAVVGGEARHASPGEFKHTDESLKKRGLIRRDDAKRSRPPSSLLAWTRQCRGRAERPDAVRANPSEVAPPCEASRFFSWDGATDLGERSALDMRRMEMVAGFERGECIVDAYEHSTVTSPTYPLLEKLVRPLETADKEYQEIEKKFLAGLGSFSTGTVVTGISRDASTRGHERLQAFEKLRESTRKVRGDENMRFAWHGTSKTGVSGIFLHGFGQPRTAKNGSAYGVGVYLAPESLSHISCVYADNDENGEQHVVLCRVILGASELVAYGSDQFHPSSEEFDTGVDDLATPKRLIVWSTHMNTHILPLYVVSFKLPPRWHQMMAAHPGKTATVHPGAAPVNQFCTAKQKCQVTTCETGTGSPASCKRGPTSPFISFPHLFLLLSPLLAPETLGCLQKCHREFKARKLTRKELIQRLRNEVGDHSLLHAIKLLQGSQMSKRQEQVKHESPIPFPAVEGIRCETPLPFIAIGNSKCGTPQSFTSIENTKCESSLPFAAVSQSSTGSLASAPARTVFETR